MDRQGTKATASAIRELTKHKSRQPRQVGIAQLGHQAHEAVGVQVAGCAATVGPWLVAVHRTRVEPARPPVERPDRDEPLVETRGKIGFLSRPPALMREGQTQTLPEEVVEQIITKTDGVPLFVEELTKMVMESDLVRAVNDHYELTGPLPPLGIPSTLQDSLMARLDRLAPVREIAQLGATLGREFSYELLHAVSPLEEDRLQEGLRQLVEAELVISFAPYAARGSVCSGSAGFSVSCRLNRGMGKTPAAWRASRHVQTISS